MGPAVWLLSLVVMLLRRREHKKDSGVDVSGKYQLPGGKHSDDRWHRGILSAAGRRRRAARGMLWRIYLRCYSRGEEEHMEYLFPTLLLTAVALVICKGILKEKIGRDTADCFCWEHCCRGEQ